MMKRTIIRHNLKGMRADVRHQKRQQAYMYFKEGKSAYYVSKTLKINERTVYSWFGRFKELGEAGIEENQRGPQKLSNAALTASQFKRLQSDVQDKTPDQIKFDFALWSSKAIQEYVQRKMGITICRRTARRYMNKLGFTYKLPERRAREQNQVQVNQWLNETYPKIKRKAKRNGAIIMWADETANMAGGERRAGYSPIGKPPILKAPDKRRIRCNSISAISNKGDLEFMFFQGGMNADIFKDFCSRLISSKDKPVYLIVDNLKVHHANVLKPWFEEKAHSNGFQIYYLPSYSPELNPDEYLNRDLKAHLAEKRIPNSSKALEKAVKKHLLFRKINKDAVKRLFQKPEVSYAL